MSEFNVGDVVICKSVHQAPELSVDDRYEVANVRKNSCGEDQVWLSYFNKWYTSRRFRLRKQQKEFELYDKYNTDDTNPTEAIPPEVVALGDKLVTTQVEWTDKHYDNNYSLTQQDIERGFVKVDPYFVSKIWKIGSKDDSGALWHCFKTIARFGEKNSKEREIRALYAQIKRLADLEKIEL